MMPTQTHRVLKKGDKGKRDTDLDVCLDLLSEIYLSTEANGNMISTT